MRSSSVRSSSLTFQMPATYSHSPCLASAAQFELDEVELWAVDDDVPVEEPEGTALDGVMGEQHAQTRAFLEMAGKKQHAAALEPV